MFEKFMIDPNWDHITETFEWVKNMKGSTQDPIHHAEGDVWIHTKMVLEELLSSQEYSVLPERQKYILFATALLHDVAKPVTRKEENGRITNKGHSRVGAIMAREILWRGNVPFDIREEICALIAFHQIPFWIVDRPDWQIQKIITEISLSTSNYLLSIFAKADAKGRICQDNNKLITNIDLFSILADDIDCLYDPYHFKSDHARVKYYQDPENRSIFDQPFDTSSFDVYLMSGLPASGKSTFSKKLDKPIISLDGIREELKIEAHKEQGLIIQTAKERAKQFLRKDEPFVWDATNLSKDLRSQLLDLFHAYNARTHIQYIEVPYSVLIERNNSRGRNMVPMVAINKMLRKWEIPTLVETYKLTRF